MHKTVKYHILRLCKTSLLVLLFMNLTCLLADTLDTTVVLHVEFICILSIQIHYFIAQPSLLHCFLEARERRKEDVVVTMSVVSAPPPSLSIYACY